MAILNHHMQFRPSFYTSFAPIFTPSTRVLSIVSPRISYAHPVNKLFITQAVKVGYNDVSSHKSSQISDDPTTIRRTANYHPCIWDFDFLQSLKSSYTGEVYDRRVENLKDNVRCMLIDEDMEGVARLELIDSLQRLGLGYLFETEIKKVLDSIAFGDNNDVCNKEGLHAIALRFRLLRQHGYEISQDIFDAFKNERGNFKESLCEDIKGMLSLYEASHLAFEGENSLDEAKEFATKYLKNTKKPIDPNLAKQVNHSLNIPLHWRILRLEARWYFDECGNDINPHLLELAKLDFNMVQATYQNDLKKTSWWRKKLDLSSKLRFARDRLVENFLWAIGVIPHPEFSTCREVLSKVGFLITVIDDVYDVYATLDEIKLFTDAVERWEINAIDQLPDYMKVCFLALYNTVNEIAYDMLKEKGLNIVPYLRKAWADLCKAYLVEGNWYHNNYTPTFQEYLNNAWISVSGPVLLLHAYFWVEKEITKEALSCLDEYTDIITLSSTIMRLWDDLGTSTDELERGDVPKSIQCYMHETGASDNIARAHIKHLISDTWKKMNKYQKLGSPFSEVAMNLARMSQFMYGHEQDGHGVSDGKTKDRIMSLLVEPVSLACTD